MLHLSISENIGISRGGMVFHTTRHHDTMHESISSACQNARKCTYLNVFRKFGGQCPNPYTGVLLGLLRSNRPVLIVSLSISVHVQYYMLNVYSQYHTVIHASIAREYTAFIGVDLTGILGGCMAGLTIKVLLQRQKTFSYIVMQVIWCLEFCNMTKSGGGACEWYCLKLFQPAEP